MTPVRDDPPADPLARDALFRSLVESLVDELPGPRTWKLCEDQRDAIVAAFPSWLDAVEPSPRGTKGALDAAAYHRRVNHLYIISKMMTDNFRVPLFSQLVAPQRHNPLAAWERKLDEAVRLTRALQLDEAASLLSDHLIDASRLPGFGYRHMCAT